MCNSREKLGRGVFSCNGVGMSPTSSEQSDPLPLRPHLPRSLSARVQLSCLVQQRSRRRGCGCSRVEGTASEDESIDSPTGR